MRIQTIFASSLLLMSSVSAFAAEPGSQLSIIHPNWEYTYYNNFLNALDGELSVYQKCAFTEEKEIDGKTYWTFTMLSQTDKDNNTVERNLPLAYMREDNGKVYMRLYSNDQMRTGEYCHRDTYGFEDRDLMVYDFNLKVGDAFQIGDPDSHPVYDPDSSKLLVTWMNLMEYKSPYAYLTMWDDGRMSVADIKQDDTSGRRVWFMHQQCTYAEYLDWSCEQRGLLDELDTEFDTTHTRTFRFMEGIGCLKSFLPFPGLYPPTFPCNWIGGFFHKRSTPMLCEVTDKTTGETIYKDERRPFIDTSVIKVGTEGDKTIPEYYTLQGMRTLNPEPGEICIVRHGAKVTKEIIGR